MKFDEFKKYGLRTDYTKAITGGVNCPHAQCDTGWPPSAFTWVSDYSDGARYSYQGEGGLLYCCKLFT